MTELVEGVLTIVKGLKPKERKEFFRELVASGLLTEDEQDVLVIQSRRRSKINGSSAQNQRVLRTEWAQKIPATRAKSVYRGL